MSCIKPIAPAREVAFASKPDSFAITALISAGSTCHVAALRSTSCSISGGGIGRGPRWSAAEARSASPCSRSRTRSSAAETSAANWPAAAGGAAPGPYCGRPSTPVGPATGGAWTGGVPVIGAILLWTAAISDAISTSQTIGEGDEFIEQLGRLRVAFTVQEGLEPRERRDRPIELGILPGNQEPGGPEIGTLAQPGQRRSYLRRGAPMRRRDDVVHRPAYTVHDLDRRKSSGLREVAVEDQVTVDQGAHRLRQRIVEPAVLGEDGRDQGDRAAACTSRALDELRELGKDARRIAAAPERFSVPECKLACTRRDARQAVDDQGDIESASAQRFGVCESELGCADSFGCAPVARRTDDRRPSVEDSHPPLRFPATLSDEPDHDHVGRDLAREPREERRLSAPRRSKDPDTRTSPERRQSIDRSDPGPQRLGDRDMLEAAWIGAALRGRIEGVAESGRTGHVANERPRFDRIARGQTARIAERRQQYLAFASRGDAREQGSTLRRNADHVAETDSGEVRFDRLWTDRDDTALRERHHVSAARTAPSSRSPSVDSSIPSRTIKTRSPLRNDGSTSIGKSIRTRSRSAGETRSLTGISSAWFSIKRAASTSIAGGASSSSRPRTSAARS